ncbi:hypothetical protein GmHk_17G049356 [Glycine max]|nr:hypothetical protein GmHk_17G049356 [Glycine max]
MPRMWLTNSNLSKVGSLFVSRRYQVELVDNIVEMLQPVIRIDPKEGLKPEPHGPYVEPQLVGILGHLFGGGPVDVLALTLQGPLCWSCMDLPCAVRAEACQPWCPGATTLLRAYVLWSGLADLVMARGRTMVLTTAGARVRLTWMTELYHCYIESISCVWDAMAYLMHMHLVYGTIFIDKSSIHVHLAYLLYLDNLDACHDIVYSECGTGALDDLVASRWKPTKGSSFAFPIREKLDKLQMDAVV